MASLILIPARGGSKGIPGKNYKEIAGKPLILHTIDFAKRETKTLDDVTICVSTDCDEVAVNTPSDVALVRRPSDLATDTSSVVEAAIHALSTLRVENNLTFTELVLLQPTAPVRPTGSLGAVLQLLQQQIHSCVISVVKVSDEHPARMYRKAEDGSAVPLWGPESEVARRQDLDSIFRRNGCFYGCSTEIFLRKKSFFSNPKYLFEMDPSLFCNIDEPQDWKVAEYLIREWHASNDN